MSTLSQKIDSVIFKMDLLHADSAETKTPVKLVNDMLDKLPAEIWQDRTKTFIDLSCGSGVFGLCILQRLFDGLQPIIPNEQERVNHILRNQIFLCDISKVMFMKASAAFVHAIRAARLINPGVHIYNENSLEHKFNMKFDVVIGNPPYQASPGYKTPTAFKDVDGKHGKKQLYYLFTKLGIQMIKENGFLIFVQPTCWRTNDDAIKLREWLNNKNVLFNYFPRPAGVDFKGVSTSSDIQIFTITPVQQDQFYGPNKIFATKSWQRAWLDASAAGHLLSAERGGLKVDVSLVETDVYQTYNEGIVKSKLCVRPVEQGTLILFPEFLAPHRKNLQKAQIVTALPFSDCFIGVKVDSNNSQDTLRWLQSEPFYEAMLWLSGSSHGGSLCQYFITEEAFNNFVRAHYEAEERISNQV